MLNILSRVSAEERNVTSQVHREEEMGFDAFVISSRMVIEVLNTDSMLLRPLTSRDAAETQIV